MWCGQLSHTCLDFPAVVDRNLELWAITPPSPKHFLSAHSIPATGRKLEQLLGLWEWVIYGQRRQLPSSWVCCGPLQPLNVEPRSLCLWIPIKKLSLAIARAAFTGLTLEWRSPCPAISDVGRGVSLWRMEAAVTIPVRKAALWHTGILCFKGHLNFSYLSLYFIFIKYIIYIYYICQGKISEPARRDDQSEGGEAPKSPIRCHFVFIS